MRDVLLIEDEEVLGKNLQKFLEMEGWNPTLARTGKEGIIHFSASHPQVVLLDLNLPDIHGLDVLKNIRRLDGSIPVLILTAYGSIESVVSTMREGATDYLTKPIDLDTLAMTLERAVESYRMKIQLSYYRRSRGFSEQIEVIGSSPASQEFRSNIQKILQILQHQGRDHNLVIVGETGSGKTFTARSIFHMSPKKDGPFVEAYCPNLPEEDPLLEILGSDGEQPLLGLVEIAAGGALLLDGIDHLPPSAQVRLRPLLEERRYRKRGGGREFQTSLFFISTISATSLENEDPSLWDPSFRETASQIVLRVPALRERSEDILELMDIFSSHLAVRHRVRMKSFTSSAQTYLLQYPWPGNILELKNFIERVYMLCEQTVLDRDDLKSHLPMAMESFSLTLPPEGISVPLMEQDLIRQALQRSGNRFREAARLLHLTPGQLQAKMRSYQMQTPRESTGDMIDDES